MSPLKKVCMAVSGFFLILSCLTTVAAILGSFYFWLFLRLPAKPFSEKKQFFIPQYQRLWSRQASPVSGGHPGCARVLSPGLAEEFPAPHAGRRIRFFDALTPEQVLDQIVNGRVVIHTVTVPEGSTLWDVARILDQKELGAARVKSSRLPGSAEFARSLEVKAKGLEGYLFPDTYQFKKPVTSASITKAMVKRFWQRLAPGVAGPG